MSAEPGAPRESREGGGPRPPHRRRTNASGPGPAPGTEPGSGGIGAWLEVARLSNAPTVITNALVGCAIAGAWNARAPTGSSALDPRSVLLLTMAMTSLYVAGMILNDWADFEVDRRERPGRPLPSGRISSAAALNATIVLLGLGAILTCIVSAAALPWVALLAAAIVAYDVNHRRAWLAIPLMALCRALAIAVPAIALTPGSEGPWPLILWFAAPLAAYIALVTIVARREIGAPGARRWLGCLLFIPALAPLGVIASGFLPRLSDGRLSALAFLIGALLSWLFRAQLFATPLPARVASRFLPRRVRPGGVRMPRAVMAWIGAVSLMDAVSLVLLGEPGLALVAVGCFFVATVSHARIAGS